MRSELARIATIFSSEIAGCRDVAGVADSLSPYAPALDLRDLHRHSLAGAVSALDTCVHSVVRAGILLQLQGYGPPLNAQLPLGADLFRRWYSGDSAALNEMELALRLAHSHWTMQKPNDIADAVRLVSSKPLWFSAAGEDTQRASYLKTSLDVIVRRRNQIVHESDYDPSTQTKWPIDSALALSAIDLVEERGKAVIAHLAAEF